MEECLCIEIDGKSLSCLDSLRMNWIQAVRVKLEIIDGLNPGRFEMNLREKIYELESIVNFESFEC